MWVWTHCCSATYLTSEFIMADNTPILADTYTLSTTDADTVTFAQWHDGVEVENKDAAEYLHVCFNPLITATAGGDDCIPIAPLQAKTFCPQLVGPDQPFSVVGDGNEYAVAGVKK